MNKRIVLSIILVLVWMGFIYYMSNMNREESNNSSQTFIMEIINKIDQITHASKETIIKHQSIDYIQRINHLFRKFCHAFEYFTLAILIFNLVIHIMRSKLFIYNILTLVLCFIYACTDEYHQTFVLGRGGLFSDVLIDTLGALIGCILISIVYSLVKKNKNKKIIYNLY